MTLLLASLILMEMIGRGFSNRIDALRRDFNMVTRRIVSGKGPSPIVDRPKRAARPNVVRTAPLRVAQPAKNLSSVSRRASEGSSKAEDVQVTLDGNSYSFSVKPGETILESATAAGVPLKSSCARGGCGTCRLRCVTGTVAMAEPNCLRDDEREEGYVLVCIGRPMDGIVLEEGQ